MDDFQIQRFERQILMRGVGGRGQKALLEARVHVCGEPADALTIAAEYLVAAGCSVAFENAPSSATTFKETPRFSPLSETPTLEMFGTPMPARIAAHAQVWIGSTTIAYCAGNGCRQCFRALVNDVGDAVDPILLATAGALASVRLMLHPSSREVGRIDFAPLPKTRRAVCPGPSRHE